MLAIHIHTEGSSFYGWAIVNELDYWSSTYPRDMCHVKILDTDIRMCIEVTLASLALAAAPRLHPCTSPALDSSQCRSKESCHPLSGVLISAAHNGSLYSSLTSSHSSLHCISGCSSLLWLTDNLVRQCLWQRAFSSARSNSNTHTMVICH